MLIIRGAYVVCVRNLCSCCCYVTYCYVVLLRAAVQAKLRIAKKGLCLCTIVQHYPATSVLVNTFYVPLSRNEFLVTDVQPLVTKWSKTEQEQKVLTVVGIAAVDDEEEENEENEDDEDDEEDEGRIVNVTVKNKKTRKTMGTIKVPSKGSFSIPVVAESALMAVSCCYVT